MSNKNKQGVYFFNKRKKSNIIGPYKHMGWLGQTIIKEIKFKVTLHNFDFSIIGKLMPSLLQIAKTILEKNKKIGRHNFKFQNSNQNSVVLPGMFLASKQQSKTSSGSKAGGVPGGASGKEPACQHWKHKR